MNDINADLINLYNELKDNPDEFIADAENYAQGSPKIVSPTQNERSVKQATLAVKTKDNLKKLSQISTNTNMIFLYLQLL